MRDSKKSPLTPLLKGGNTHTPASLFAASAVLKPLQAITSPPFDKGDRGILKSTNQNKISTFAKINLHATFRYQTESSSERPHFFMVKIFPEPDATGQFSQILPLSNTDEFFKRLMNQFFLCFRFTAGKCIVHQGVIDVDFHTHCKLHFL